MRKNAPVTAALADILAAAALLTRLPLPDAPLIGARAAWAYPVIGAGVGLMAGMIGLLALFCGLPAPLAALGALAAQVTLTGALHEDGLADSADGLWGGWTRERRLDIMKDSGIGTYGNVALILSLAARWAAIWTLFQMDTGWALAALVVAGAVSRAAMPALMWALPHARDAGLSHGTGRASGRVCAVAAGLAAIIALVLTGWAAIPALIWAALAMGAVGLIARSKIGGQTGDILGAAQQTAEIAALLSLLT